MEMERGHFCTYLHRTQKWSSTPVTDSTPVADSLANIMRSLLWLLLIGTQGLWCTADRAHLTKMMEHLTFKMMEHLTYHT